LSNSYSAEKPAQLFVISYCQLQMSRNDSSLLVIAGGVPSQLEYFGGQVFHDSSKVNRSSGTDTFTVISLFQETMNATNRELDCVE
ncbi:hypothetical protein T02_14644, partial [Trichinella nativa]